MLGLSSRVFLVSCLLVNSYHFSLCQDYEDPTSGPPSDEQPSEETTSPAPTSPTSPKPKPPRVGTTKPPDTKRPCNCTGGNCKCCTGAVLNRFNATQQTFLARNKACVNILYDPDDFEFKYKLMLNERVLLQNTISGKNPRAACIPFINRFFPGNLCLKFSNVYMVGRNFHACLELEGVWNEQELFGVAFDCIRLGANGIALVKPEDGGGLPTQVVEEVLSPEQEDYDDSARNEPNSASNKS